MKELSEFTREEYKKLKDTGMFWEFYPEATGNYEDDCLFGYIQELKENQPDVKVSRHQPSLGEFYRFSHIIDGSEETFYYSAEEGSTEEFMNAMLHFYEAMTFQNPLEITVKMGIYGDEKYYF